MNLQIHWQSAPLFSNGLPHIADSMEMKEMMHSQRLNHIFHIQQRAEKHYQDNNEKEMGR